ncbi:MAG: hypothetical protein OHK006_14460 [Thermodesulfovibrionales bacterium]
MGLLNLLARSLSPEREMVRIEREIDLARERAQTDPENAEIWRQLGDLYLKIGLVGSASQAYQDAVNLYLQRNAQGKALEIFRKLVFFNFFDLPKFERIFLDQGLRDQVIARYRAVAAQIRTTDASYAQDIFRRILSIDPLHEEARRVLGVRGQAAPAPQELPVVFRIPETKLLACASPPAMLANEAAETAAEAPPAPLAEIPVQSSGGADPNIDQLIRESMQQQREMLELMESLLKKAAESAAAAGGSQNHS